MTDPSRPAALGLTRAMASVFDDGVGVARDVELAEAIGLVRPDRTVWLDLQAPGPDELKQLESEFALHELAVADVAGGPERPRLSAYENHLFLTMHATGLANGRVTASQVAAFVLPGALITVRPASAFDIGAVAARWRAHPGRVDGGVATVLYLLLDQIVTGHLDTLQELDERVDDLEGEMFDVAGAAALGIQRQLLALRKDLVLLRRAVLPMRELLTRLLRPEAGLVPAVLTTYYQDVHDQVVRVGEWSELLRELVSSVVETNLTVQSNRTNTTMKKVTGWAAIIAVPTLITGFYGQNVPYPGAGQISGVVTSVLLMAVSAVLLYVVFRRNDWL